MGRSGAGLGWLIVVCGIVIAAIGIVLLFDPTDDTSAVPSATTSAESAATSTATPSTTSIEATTTTVPATTIAAPTTVTASTTTTTAAVEPTTTAATTSTTEPLDPAAAIDAFFKSFSAALQTGDASFLTAHLSPLVLDRYDSAACDARLGDLQIPQGAVEFVEIMQAGAWDWTTDDITRTIDAVTTVKTRTTSDGTTFDDTESHVVLQRDGFVYWFTDCGTPKGGAL